MNALDDESLLSGLIDQQQISTLVVKLARAMDRNDRVEILAAYHPGALDHHGEFDGPVEALIDWIHALHTERLETMSHLITNHYVEIVGDHARGETYVTASIRTREVAGQQFDLTAIGRYLDRYERRDGRWRIADRVVVLDWQRMDPVPRGDESVVDVRLRGSNTAADPSYEHFRW